MKSLPIFGFKKAGVENENKRVRLLLPYVLTVLEHVYILMCGYHLFLLGGRWQLKSWKLFLLGGVSKHWQLKRTTRPKPHLQTPEMSWRSPARLRTVVFVSLRDVELCEKALTVLFLYYLNTTGNKWFLEGFDFGLSLNYLKSFQ